MKKKKNTSRFKNSIYGKIIYMAICDGYYDGADDDHKVYEYDYITNKWMYASQYG